MCAIECNLGIPIYVWKQKIQIQICSLESDSSFVDNELIFGHVDHTGSECLQRQR